MLGFGNARASSFTVGSMPQTSVWAGDKQSDRVEVGSTSIWLLELSMAETSRESATSSHILSQPALLQMQVLRFKAVPLNALVEQKKERYIQRPMPDDVLDKSHNVPHRSTIPRFDMH